MAADRGRFGRLGVRWQAAVVAVAAVGLTLVLGAAALILLTERSLQSSIEATVAARADGVVALVEADAVTDPLPGRDPELLAQIVDRGSVVLAADRAAQGLPALVDVVVAPGRREILRIADLAEGIEPEVDIEDSGPFAVVAEGVRLDGGPATVLVAGSLEDASAVRGALLPLLGFGLPAVLAVVGLVTWLLTGRALRPVDDMRREADRISALALDRRLPQPAARDELHRLAVTLNDMLERLERSATRQRQFVGDASHELKSPLTTLRAIVDIAGRSPTEMDTAELVEDIGEQVARMERLVADLLALARYDEAAVAPATPVDLGAISAHAAAGAAQHGEATVETSGLQPVIVQGEPAAVMRAVHNLIENAARHAATTVWVETRRHHDVGELWVSDDGPGVPSADAERIFERFVRLDESRTRATGGTGLGLAVARAIARTFGGDVVLAPPRHGGASFVLTLPAVAGEDS
jgi:signal transduction histidine kinase